MDFESVNKFKSVIPPIGEVLVDPVEPGNYLSSLNEIQGPAPYRLYLNPIRDVVPRLISGNCGGRKIDVPRRLATVADVLYRRKHAPDDVMENWNSRDISTSSIFVYHQNGSGIIIREADFVTDLSTYHSGVGNSVIESGGDFYFSSKKWKELRGGLLTRSVDDVLRLSSNEVKELYFVDSRYNLHEKKWVPSDNLIKKILTFLVGDKIDPCTYAQSAPLPPGRSRDSLLRSLGFYLGPENDTKSRLKNISSEFGDRVAIGKLLQVRRYNTAIAGYHNFRPGFFVGIAKQQATQACTGTLEAKIVEGIAKKTSFVDSDGTHWAPLHPNIRFLK